MKYARLIVSGRVQGVFFRDNIKKFADKSGLNGFVRNLSNGNVEIAAEGSEGKLKQLIDFCKSSPGISHVEDVEVEYEQPTGEFRGFRVII